MGLVPGLLSGGVFAFPDVPIMRTSLIFVTVAI